MNNLKKKVKLLSLSKASNIALLFFLIFLIPSNLFFKFFENQVYVHGLLIDYLIPKLYVSDLIIILFIFNNFKLIFSVKNKEQSIKNKKSILILLSLISCLLLRQFFTPNPTASLWYFAKLIEMFLLAVVLLQNRELFKEQVVKLTFPITILFQSILSIFQFHTQSSLLGYLFLGEPNLSNYIGLAKGNFFGVEQILPYGTTAHPNILAGFLVIYFYLGTKFLKNSKKLYKILFWTSSIFGLYTLWLTQSVSAWMALIIVLIFSHPEFSSGSQKKQRSRTESGMTKAFFLFLIGVFVLAPLAINRIANIDNSSTSISRRNYLNQAAWQMFLDKPLLGVGLNNFTVELENYSVNNETIRFVQPAHHIGLLILSETGIAGLTLLIIIIDLINKHKFQFTNSNLQTKFFGIKNLGIGNCLDIGYWNLVLILLPIATHDHYLLTNQTGLLLLTFAIGILSFATE